MIEMNKDWRSQISISNEDWMGLRYAPFCFPEQGVAMLSSAPAARMEAASFFEARKKDTADSLKWRPKKN